MKEEKGKASPKTSTGGEKEASQTNIDQCYSLLLPCNGIGRGAFPFPLYK